MARVAFVNMGLAAAGNGKKRIVDPIHLVPMRNECLRAGHRSEIFLHEYPSRKASVDAIKEFKPEVLGFSVIDSDRSSIEGVNAILRSFNGNVPTVLLGGPDVAANTAMYIGELAKYQLGQDRFLLAIGAGEALMDRLARNGFDFSSDVNLSDLGRVGRFGDATIISDLKRTPLDLLDFSWAHEDLGRHKGEAVVRWSTGCWATCSFCPNDAIGADYRSADLIRAEASDLMQKDVMLFNFASPDHLSDPARGTASIFAVPSFRVPIAFSARVDSLYRAITGHKELWDVLRFRPMIISPGFESFIPARLRRMGKYNNEKGYIGHESRIREILDYFDGSRVILKPEFIMFDWKMDLEELGQDISKLSKAILFYPKNVYVPLYAIANVLHSAPGSSLSKVMKPEDFLKFNDPRILLIALYINDKCARGIPVGINQKILTYELLEFLQDCVEMLKGLPQDLFDVNAVADIYKNGGSFAEMLDNIYSQVGFRNGIKLKRYFDEGFNEAVKSTEELHGK